jgi:hypothetical protein
MLGHASAAMTLDRYADLFDSDLDAVADRLDVISATARLNILRTFCGLAAQNVILKVPLNHLQLSKYWAFVRGR